MTGARKRSIRKRPNLDEGQERTLQGSNIYAESYKNE